METNEKIKDRKTEKLADSELWKKSKRGFFHVLFGRTTVIILLLVLQFAGLFGIFAYFERYVSLAYGGFAVIALIMAIYVTSSRANPAVKLSWIVLIMTFPVFGTLLYLFVDKEFGHHFMHRRLQRVLDSTRRFTASDPNLVAELEASDKALANMARYAGEKAGYPIYRAEYAHYFPEGEAFWLDLLDTLEKAEHFIFLEYFILEEGEMWGRILDILKRKAAHGVEVRVLYDGTCAITLLPYDYPKTLAKLGIHCRMFAPLRPFVSTHYNNRDHRKIAVIDGKTAYTGGANLADEYINRKNRFGHWKDAAVRIDGCAVRSFTLMFLQMWNIPQKTDEENYEKYLSASGADTAGKNRHGYVIPYADSPLDGEKVGETVYMDMINTACGHIYIFTPYLILDNEMTTALQNAAKRGVDVRIVLPSVPDHKIAFALAKIHASELIPSGVRIYTYTPGFVHSKVFESDGRRAAVGTVNLDYRSLYLHFECAAYFADLPVIDEIRADFDETFAVCRELRAADLKKNTFLRRLYGGLLKLIAPLM